MSPKQHGKPNKAVKKKKTQDDISTHGVTSMTSEDNFRWNISVLSGTIDMLSATHSEAQKFIKDVEDFSISMATAKSTNQNGNNNQVRIPTARIEDEVFDADPPVAAL